MRQGRGCCCPLAACWSRWPAACLMPLGGAAADCAWAAGRSDGEGGKRRAAATCPLSFSPCVPSPHSEVYDLLSPGFSGRCTAPLLVDVKARKAVRLLVWQPLAQGGGCLCWPCCPCSFPTHPQTWYRHRSATRAQSSPAT